MKEIKRRELELLAKICNQNNVPLKLAKDLIKAAEKFTYENVSPGARMKDYQEFIDIHTKHRNDNNEN